MADIKPRVWMLRAGRGGFLIEEFLKNNIVAIGWNELGEVNKELSYEELKKQFREVYAGDPAGSVNQSVSQIWKFVHDFKIGDRIVSYDSSARLYYLGEISSGYKFNKELEYHNYREVRWEGRKIDRDFLSTNTKNLLGSILTIFELSEDVWQELKNAYKEKRDEIENLNVMELAQERLDLEQLKEDVAAKSLEFIKDILANISWQDTEKLVAGLLNALGYKTRFTGNGGDLGSDLLASADILGLDGPVIKVEVKKRTNDKIGAPEIRNFIGGLQRHHKGIFVTTSGFSKEAKYEAERANFPITLIDSDWLTELITTHYDLLDPEIKALIPLRKIYWPV